MDSESPRMASRLIKFLISLAFYVAAEGWRALLKIVGRTPPPGAVVIYYHHVLNEQRQSFERQLDHLLRWTQPLRADSKEPLRSNARYSIVTADDGWKSFADNALPELKRRTIPVTMFVISERLGQSIDEVMLDRLVSAAELRTLDAGLVTIGSHTATHRKMTALTKPEALRELCDSSAQLADILGRDVTMFCFPYGACHAELISMCSAAGYDRVFTCMPQLSNLSQFVLGRVRVDPTDWPLEFHLKLMGAYRWLPTAISLKRRLISAFHFTTPAEHSTSVAAD